MTVTAVRPAWLSGGLYPFQSRWVDAHGARVHYLDEGPAHPGPTLLFVHGNPTWSFLYREIVRDLRDDFRCVAIDLPGFGLSEPPAGYRFTPLEHAQVLERVVLELDLEDVAVMGQDWGGPIGFAVAGWQPERFAGLIVGNTWAWPMTSPPAHVWSRLAGSPLARLMIERGVQAGTRRTSLSEEVVEHYRRPARLEAVQALGRAVTDAAPFLAEVERGLERIADRPALLVWPTADPLFNDGVLRRWQDLLTETATVRLEGAGHFIQEDAPQEIATAIRDWHSLS